MAKPSGTVPSGKPSVPRTATLAALTPNARQPSNSISLSGVISVTERSRSGTWARGGRNDA